VPKPIPHWLLIVGSFSVALVAACSSSRAPESAADGGSHVLPAHIAGKACKRDAECATGRCAASLLITAGAPTAAPGGYCTTTCDTDSTCGEGAECSVTSDADSGECLASCRAVADCRAGYHCVGAGSVAGMSFSGSCRPEPPTDKLGDRVAGRACAADADCLGGRCASTTAVGSDYPGNYCSGDCLEDAQCGAGGACLTLAGSGDAGRCYAHCESDADCSRRGYRCWPIADGFHACYPVPAALPDNTTGKPCAGDPDCGGGADTCASMLPFGSFPANELVPAPGGYCTQECSLDSECGAGAQCINRGAQGGMCLAICTTMDDCRDGYSCAVHLRDNRADEKVCAPLIH
jgi:hypothetical protein